jgi:4-aminobutyrate aminotransferase-like enzyme
MPASCTAILILGTLWPVLRPSSILDIVVKERLADNAADVGNYFIGRLRNLADRQKHVREVRGQGLMIGVEPVVGKDTKARF